MCVGAWPGQSLHQRDCIHFRVRIFRIGKVVVFQVSSILIFFYPFIRRLELLSNLFASREDAKPCMLNGTLD